jgi:two-component system, NarL family, response regulator YdfI
MISKAVAAPATPVLIVAESAERRIALRSLLSGQPEFDVTAVDPDHVSPQAQSGVIVVDAEDELAVVARSLAASSTGIVWLAENPDVHSIAQIFSPRPIAVLKRDCALKQFVAAVQAVAAGLTVLDADMLERLSRPPLDMIALEPGEEELTSRETEVLQMMTAGLSNREIGSTLGISEHTVKFHIASIFGKLGTSSRTEAVTEGIRRGLILL